MGTPAASVIYVPPASCIGDCGPALEPTGARVDRRRRVRLPTRQRYRLHHHGEGRVLPSRSLVIDRLTRLAGRASVQVAVTVAVKDDPHWFGLSIRSGKGQVNAMTT